ncbi:MAG: hypothetical protein ACRDTE_26905 [Pseudonocardiaceae bacterium]
MPEAKPGNRSLEMLAGPRVTRGGDGLIDSIDGKTLKEYLEVKAVNALLWNHPGGFGAEVFKELRVANYFPFEDRGVRPAPCCANCNALLKDVPSNAGRFTGYPPSNDNLLEE